MMDGCVYNQMLNSKTHHVPWKEIYLALMNFSMRQLTAIYSFVVAVIQKPPEWCLSGIRQFGRFCIYSIRKPHHCLVYIVINYYLLITFITACHTIFIRCEMLDIAVSSGLCFKFDKRGDISQV